MPINSINSIPPPHLKSGDTIEIIASAKFVKLNDIDTAVELIKKAGFNILLSKSVFKKDAVFAGTVEERLESLQDALDNDKSKAILFARGGYGSIHLIDKLDFTTYYKSPKWLIGFSDMTTILMHVQAKYSIQSIHGPMAYNFKKLEKKSLTKLLSCLKGRNESLEIRPNPLNRVGESTGVLIGGNLSIFCSLIGSLSFPKNHNQHILFLEEIDEYLYHIERMLYILDRAGVLRNLKGLIIGHMTNILDNEVAFGKTAKEIILDLVKKYNYPVAFNIPVGHNNLNNPLVIGSEIQLNVTKDKTIIKYLN